MFAANKLFFHVTFCKEKLAEEIIRIFFEHCISISNKQIDKAEIKPLHVHRQCRQNLLFSLMSMLCSVHHWASMNAQVNQNAVLYGAVYCSIR